MCIPISFINPAERPNRRRGDPKWFPLRFFLNKTERRSLFRTVLRRSRLIFEAYLKPMNMKRENRKEKRGLARLFALAGRRRGLLVAAGALSALSALGMLVPYGAVYGILRELLTAGAAGVQPESRLIVRCGWLALAGLAAALLLLYASLMCSHVAAFRLLYGLRLRLAEHIGRLSPGFLASTSVGAVKKTMEQNIEKVETFVAHTIPDVVNVLSTVVFMFVIFFSLSVPMAGVCLLAVAVAFVLQYANFMGRKARSFTKAYFDAQERMSASAVEYVRGIQVVKMFGRSIFSLRRFHREILDYKAWALRVCDSYEGGMVAFSVLLGSVVTLLVPAGLLLMQGRPHDAALAVVWLFFVVMGPGGAAPVYKLMFLGGGTREIDEGVERLARIFAERPLPEPLRPQLPLTYDVEFRDVTFAYDTSHDAAAAPALSHVSFRAPQGQVTALVGPSGSGKSTAASLIPRFWDVSGGAVLIGGVDVRSIATEQLMQLVGFVFQETFLFYDTLYANIAVGRPGATRAEVEQAARDACCHELIGRLPQGYDTLIGRGGVYLSGGEAQRVCVARAFLKNAPILVLDEATAFADADNEHRMQQALSRLARGKTVIVIAHRLASIAGAAQIVVLDGGHVVQTGRHAALADEPGVYRRMWQAYTEAGRWTLSTHSAGHERTSHFKQERK